MKQIYLVLITLLVTSIQSTAQNSSLSWVQRTGSINNDVGNSLCKDASGNIYTIGYFQGTSLPFLGGTTNISVVNGTDIFISKQNAAGELIWVKTFGGNNYDEGVDVTVDQQGNVYATGLFYTTTDFNPAPGATNVFNMTSAGQSDVFVLKLNSNGDFVWARRFGGSSDDEPTKIVVDNAGNIYTTGIFAATVDFNPGTAVNSIATTGLIDGFVQKMTSNGDFVWARRVGGTSNDFINSACIVNGNQIAFGGTFNGTVDFDPGTPIVNLSSTGLFEAFISIYDQNGNYIWAKRYGSTDADEVRSLAVTPNQKIVSIGTFKATVNFGGTNNTFTALAGGQDIFVMQLAADGTTEWAKQFGGNGNDIGIGIASDANGNVYACGSFQGTADFDPNSGVSNLIAGGSADAFIVKLNLLGQYNWAKNFGKTAGGATFGRDVEIDDLNNVYSIGSYYTISNFNPNSGTLLLSSSGSADVFFHKMFQCDASNSTGDDCNKSLNVNVLIEGYVDPNALPLVKMKPVSLNQVLPGALPTDCDNITIELRNSVPPFNVIASSQALLNVDGISKVTFNPQLTSSYYIAIKHRNSIETWSSNPINFSSGEVFYDFTTNANKAYGDNQANIQGTTKYALFSGDINQDGAVSTQDYSLWEFDANNFESGFLQTDLDGNGSVDNNDYVLWETNGNNFTSVINP